MAQAQGADGGGGGLEELALDIGGLARRGDVERLFEVGAFERVGLVEDGERLKAAGGDQAFDGELAAGEVSST